VTDDLRVVAFGGGTGLPVVLSGLRERVEADLTAVVTVTDDGGSSGRLRQELGIAPPGDVRNCLVALAGRRQLAEVFSYRFDSGVELRDHTVGNIVIAALTNLSGGFSEGIEQAARLLRVKGVVLPAATESLTLLVRYVDGSVTRGESAVRYAGKAVARIAVEPHDVPAPAEALTAIDRADIVVLSPGSLYTSTIPALLGGGVADALGAFRGPVVYAANLMTQPGETVGFTLGDHLRAIAEHVGPIVTDVLVNSAMLTDQALARYREDGAAPVEIDSGECERLGIRMHEAPLLPVALGKEVRHDPNRVAEAICAIARA
jgi:uncharacterized cofD-like protein